MVLHFLLERKRGTDAYASVSNLPIYCDLFGHGFCWERVAFVEGGRGGRMEAAVGGCIRKRVKWDLWEHPISLKGIILFWVQTGLQMLTTDCLSAKLL